MFADCTLRLLLGRLEAAANQFPDCWHFLIRANHPAWPHLPHPDDRSCVHPGILPNLVAGVVDVAFGLNGQDSDAPEHRERYFLDLGWIVREGHLYQAMMMDRHGGKDTGCFRLLQEAKSRFEREAGGATDVWLPPALGEDHDPGLAAWITLPHGCLEAIYGALPLENRRVARTKDGRFYDGDATLRSSDESFTVVIPRPPGLFASMAATVAKMLDSRQSPTGAASKETAEATTPTVRYGNRHAADLAVTIEALLNFVAANTDKYLSAQEVEELRHLDERFYALCLVTGLSSVALPLPKQSHFHPFGNCKVPHYFSTPVTFPSEGGGIQAAMLGQGGMKLWPTTAWTQAMRGLRTAAGLLSEPSRGGEGESPSAAGGQVADQKSVVTKGQGEVGGEGDKPAAPVPKEEAEIIVRNYIKKREKAGERITARGVARDCGIALGRVSELATWQAYQARKKGRLRPQNPKDIKQLTDNMLAAIGKKDTPDAGLVEAEEAAWRYLLDNAKSSDERARLHAMTNAEKAEAIQLVIDQFADQDRRGKRGER